MINKYIDKKIGLLIIDTIQYEDTLDAIEKTLKIIQPYYIFWCSDIKCPKKYEEINIINIRIPKLIRQPYECSAWIKYTNIIFDVIPPFILDTDVDFIFTIQADGYPVNIEAWDDDFLNYDYIGAPFTHSRFDSSNNVGNGGFSLRSRKLIESLYDLNTHIDFNYRQLDNEDVLISSVFRPHLEETYKIKFANEYLAAKFSMENLFQEDYKNIWFGHSFGFHGKHNIKNYIEK